MSTMTLLAMTQDILNDMDSDEVNSISDTIESQQVAQIVKTTFFEFISRRDWPHLRKITTLDSVGDSSIPVYLRIPALTSKMEGVWYDVAKDGETRLKYRPMRYLYPDNFLQETNQRNNDNDNVDVITGVDGIKLLIMNDRAPTYWTSFDDDYIVFDSYESDKESTLQGSNSQVELYVTPTWTHTDNSIPDLPIEAFPGFLAEAKSAATLKLKQVADEKAEQQAVRQSKVMSQRNWKAKGGTRYPSYGRQGGKMYVSNENRLFNREGQTGV